ncbi:hypothetical protein Q7P37_000741 [Cladosporium fusiforme]
MSGHKRVKDIDYDDDDIYSGDEEEYDNTGDDGLTAEDRQNFSTLTPVVRAELDEAGVQAENKEIEDALWHYFWDVGKSVTYLKNAKQPKTPSAKSVTPKEKPKSKFDQAQEKSAEKAGGGWFSNVSWSAVPSHMTGDLIPSQPQRPTPKLLGGSSKLAKLAEERRKKAEAARHGTAQPTESETKKTTSALDRLTLGNSAEQKDNTIPEPSPEPRKYVSRKKREPTSPPAEPEPEPEEEQEQLPDLRAPPTAFGRAISTCPITGNLSNPMSLQDMLGSATKADAFQNPSPDDVVSRAQTTGSSGNSTPKSGKSVNNLQKKTENLNLNSTPPTPVQPKTKSKNLDVPKLWAEAESALKPSAAFVVIGHVDHGKSTLMGRLLLDTGAVPQRDIDKYRKEAAEKGKGSFALAWVMDTSSDERERGVTVDIAQHFFSTDNADFAILDAPGHRDFVPNMIGGAAMADLGVLVVDANQLESGLKGQTKEHVLLARAVGLERMIVAVNKMDGTTPEWNQGTFEEVSGEVKKLLADAGFEDENIKVVPCSGLSGDNVAKAPSSGNAAWVSESCGTLTSALESMAGTVHISAEAVKGSLRMQITDIFRGGVQNPFSISGRLASGNVQAGDSIVVQPRGEHAVVKGVEVANEPRDYAVAGQLATLHLESGDMESLERNLKAGDTLCLASKPVQVVKEFAVDIDAIGTLLPSAVDVHVGRLHVPGRIAALTELREKKGGEITKKKPRVVQPGQFVKVKIVVDDGVAVEYGTGVVLRHGGETIGRGIVG